MRLAKSLRSLIASVSILALASCAPAGGPQAPPGSGSGPQTVSQRSASDQRTGDQNHPKILAQFGGEIADERLKAYVRNIGQRLASQTEQPNARWTFTVLDSPVVNAFALPGGYIYVTRGLVALANDEAELASVIGHEIGHVTAAHSAQRQEQAGIAQLGVLGATIFGAAIGLSGPALQSVTQLGSTLGQGYVASYSRNQEFEADNLGIRYMAQSGYDPQAGSDFLANLQAETKLQARIAGGRYNPNRVDFFASHPATAQRVSQAAAIAQRLGVEGAPRNRNRFLAAIDGMVYGDSAEQGFVRGQRFVHPKLRFEFTMPRQFKIQNSAAKVTAAGPNGSGIIFDGDRARGGSVDAYIARVWAPGIAENARVGQLSGLRRLNINGLSAAEAVLPVQTRNGVSILRMTAIRKGDTIYRFLGVQPQGQDGLARPMAQAARSFNALTAQQAARERPLRIGIRTVQRGDTVARLADQTPFNDFKRNRFRVLNGIPTGGAVRAGDKVKLIVR
ncbi:MAG: M48 family metalloprotease [Pseudomonadota bacterium]